LITSVLAIFQYESGRGIDPVLIFLLLTYPLLIGSTVHFYLQQKRTHATLNEEYYVKWYLQSFAQLCLTESDFQLIRDELTNSILRMIKPALVNVYELNTENLHLEMVRQAGIQDLPENARGGYPLGQGIPGWVMQNQNAVVLGDISKEQALQVDAWARTLNLRSYAAVPIIARGKAVGIIAMYSLESNFFQDSNLLSAQLLAQLYGLSLAGQPSSP